MSFASEEANRALESPVPLGCNELVADVRVDTESTELSDSVRETCEQPAASDPSEQLITTVAPAILPSQDAPAPASVDRADSDDEWDMVDACDDSICALSSAGSGALSLSEARDHEWTLICEAETSSVTATDCETLPDENAIAPDFAGQAPLTTPKTFAQVARSASEALHAAVKPKSTTAQARSNLVRHYVRATPKAQRHDGLPRWKDAGVFYQ